ncbi:hypothetical protein [Roseibacillus persicicus]|uniref:hypothetical protein n=1 Tax=Roseibacillus persicicus TaxID=454148 RepID=UPI00280E7B89|nr:hypothetical protein [Roseibacillus persicicus]MDQ8191183.1 hypothetical protein [Roseibacillus persicicus]
MSETPRKLPYEQRARSLPHKLHYHASLCWAVLFYMLLSFIAAAGVGFALDGNEKNAYLLIALTFLAIPVWLLGYLSRRKATCPLCKGTPLLDSQASKHVKAFRLFPLNYGNTNIVRAITTRRIRCHFCGTPFDMLKNNLQPNQEEQGSRNGHHS